MTSNEAGGRQPSRASTAPLPVGFGIELDSWTKQLTPELWFGGSPVRVARLTPAGQAAWRNLRAAGQVPGGPPNRTAGAARVEGSSPGSSGAARVQGPSPGSSGAARVEGSSPGSSGAVRVQGRSSGTLRVTSRATGALARYFTDTGLAHPVPPVGYVVPAATVIVPVRDRADLLERCLAALGGARPVIVVDDASRDPAAVAEVAARHGAKLIRREINGGPAAARNTGLAEVSSELVAFVDSDCEPSTAAVNAGLAEGGSAPVALVDSDCGPSGDWIERLAGHFADPMVAVVAPRITGRADHTTAGRYTEANGALDLGGRPGRVMPKAAVSFVPTAAVLARREALLAVARDDAVFDESMRVGEDVDLIWRLHEAGWRIRYDPSVRVVHQEPASWPELLARRYRYGTSAAALAQRHPGDIVHLAIQPWPAATVAALLARRPVLAAAAFSVAVATTGHRLRQAGVPQAGLTRATIAATRQTWLGLGRYATQFAAPLLIAAIAAPARSGRARHPLPGPAEISRLPAGPARAGLRASFGLAGVGFGPSSGLAGAGFRPSSGLAGAGFGPSSGLAGAGFGPFSGLARRWARRAAVASLLVGPPLTAWAEGTRTLDPVRFVLGRIADDVAYGAGVFSGCVARRTLSALRPVISWRPLRIDPVAHRAPPAAQDS